MLKKIALAVLLSTCLSAVAAVAQEKPTVYRLEYTVVETEGSKKLSSRSYTLVVVDGKRGQMRVGTRVPVRNGNGDSFNYMDIGVSLDAQPSLLDATTLRLDTTIDITSIVALDTPTARVPITRSCRDSAVALISVDKLVTLMTQDDPSNNNTLQVQVIARVVK